MRTMRSALLTLVAAILACACLASPALARTAIIDAVDSPSSAFQPPNVTIETGDTVRWEFDQASTTHTVTSTGANWATPLNESRGPNGAPIERTFNTAGTYNFLCTLHTGMTGSITVEAPNLDRVLVFSRTGGFRHDSIPQGIAAIQAARHGQRLHGRRHRGPGPVHRRQPRRRSTSSSSSPPPARSSTTPSRRAFERYIQGGGGYAGIHAASDTEYTWPWYGELVGGYFRSHPPGTPNADVKIEDGNEPSTTGLPATWNRDDEWYNYQHPTDPGRQRQHDGRRLQPAGPARERPRHGRRGHVRRAGRQHGR